MFRGGYRHRRTHTPLRLALPWRREVAGLTGRVFHHLLTVVQVAAALAADPPGRVAVVRIQLTKLNDREFWEVGERSSNAEYLTPAQQQQLPRFFRLWGDCLEVDGTPPGSVQVEDADLSLHYAPPGLVRSSPLPQATLTPDP